MQSPSLAPRMMLESPALAPHQPPVQQFEEGYTFMERRKSSVAGDGQDILAIRKGTEDGVDLNELKRFRPLRREAIILLDTVKEEPDVDKDGFKRPREFKTNENQEYATKEENRKESEENGGGAMLPPLNLLQPTMFPMQHIEERKEPSPEKENFHVLLPLTQAAFLPQAVTTPILTSALLPPSYTTDYMPYIQPGAHATAYSAGFIDPNRSMDYGRKGSEISFKMLEGIPEGLQPNYFSPFLQPSPAVHQTPQYVTTESVNMQLFPQPDEFRLDGAEANPAWKAAPVNPPVEIKPHAESLPEKKIGTLTVTERREKILKYLEKRKRRIWKKKISYDCRKKVADKRLRIKGRFVTREQAYAILGTTAEDLANNELLRTLVSSNNNCSIITSAQNMKIRNIQTLFMSSEKIKEKDGEVQVDHQTESKRVEISVPAPKEDEKGNNGNHELRVEILKENVRDQTVEIKIETVVKKGLGDSTIQEKRDPKSLQLRMNGRLPRIPEQIFQFKKLKLEELDPIHTKYHKEVGAF